MVAKGHFETLERIERELEEYNWQLAVHVKAMNEAWLRRGGQPLMP